MYALLSEKWNIEPFREYIADYLKDDENDKLLRVKHREYSKYVFNWGQVRVCDDAILIDNFGYMLVDGKVVDVTLYEDQTTIGKLQTHSKRAHSPTFMCYLQGICYIMRADDDEDLVDLLEKLPINLVEIYSPLDCLLRLELVSAMKKGMYEYRIATIGYGYYMSGNVAYGNGKLIFTKINNDSLEAVIIDFSNSRLIYKEIDVNNKGYSDSSYDIFTKGVSQYTLHIHNDAFCDIKMYINNARKRTMRKISKILDHNKISYEIYRCYFSN
jgi:hypothetical protein